MNLTVEQLLTAALSLPKEDRLHVAEALMSSLEPVDQPSFNESWRDIVQRRSAELKAGQVSPVPWEEVKRRTSDNSVLNF